MRIPDPAPGPATAGQTDSSQVEKVSRSRLGAYAVVGLALAVVFWFRIPALSETVFGFTHDFLSIADTIDQTGTYSVQLNNGRIIPETLREPLYPYALVAAKTILGSYTYIAPIQATVAVAVFLTWVFVTWRLLGFVWSLGMAALIYLNPALFFYSAVLYPYAFNVFLLSTGFLFLWLLLARRNTRWAVAAGFAFGLMAYERGSLALLPFFLGFCLLWFPSLVSRRALLALVLTHALCIGPWLARNASLGIVGMHGMMGEIIGYTYGDLVVAENDRTAAAPEKDPFGFRQGYVEAIRLDGTDVASWGLVHGLEEEGWTQARINRVLTFYVTQAIRHQPGAALRIVLHNLYWFPSRMIKMWVPLNDPWDFYVANAQAKDPTRGDWLVVIGCIMGLALMAANREPLLAIILPFLFYMVPINVLLVVSDPRYRNGLFDIFAFFSLLYALRCLWFQMRRGGWRGARLGGLAALRAH